MNKGIISIYWGDEEKLPIKRLKESVKKFHPELEHKFIKLDAPEKNASSLKLKSQMFDLLGFTKEEAQAQFGFLMNAFEYGAPPHGGLAFGLDRLVATMGGSESIRDYIAFPKNNSGRDTMIDAPSPLDEKQLKELGISLRG